MDGQGSSAFMERRKEKTLFGVEGKAVDWAGVCFSLVKDGIDFVLIDRDSIAVAIVMSR